MGLTSGCEAIPTSVAPVAPQSNDMHIVEDEYQTEINNLMHKASLAFERNRLTTPLEDNAYFRYLQVLSIEPAHILANQGITEIAEKYLEWAINAAESDRYQQAYSYLNKARSVDEWHPSITAIEKMIEDRQAAHHMIYPLPLEALNDRQESLVAALHDIAKSVELQQAIVIINAPTDKEGRWIYQQLNDATDIRIRATFQPRELPSVQLIFK